MSTRMQQVLVILVVAGSALGWTAPGASAAGTVSWHAAASMHHGREPAAAVLLKDGRVMVIGGDDTRTFPPTPLASAEIYEPAKDAWVAAASMHTARTGALAVRLGSGKVLVVGGGPDQIITVGPRGVVKPTWC